MITISALRFVDPHQRTPAMDERDAEIIRRRMAGEYPVDIKEAMNLREAAVYNALRLARLRGVEFPRIPLGRRPRKNEERYAAILKLYADGLAYNEIARRLQIPRGSVGHVIHQHAKAGVITLRTETEAVVPLPPRRGT
jgi:DNA-binding CsgD family transcriptional regulator